MEDYLNAALVAINKAQSEVAMSFDDDSNARGWLTTSYLNIKAAMGEPEGLQLWERIQNDFNVKSEDWSDD